MSLWWLLLVPLIALLIGSLRHYLAKEAQASRLWFPNEQSYVDPHNASSRVEFPSLTDSPAVYLSVIIPAYNEEKRLPFMLDEALAYLSGRASRDTSFTYELIIVDDGSKDETAQVTMRYVQRETVSKFRLLKLAQNRGKGGAVKRGMLCARGKYLLMVDADGATKFSDIEKLEKGLQDVQTNGMGIAVGSRHLKDTNVKKSLFRNLLTWGFHFITEFLCVRGVNDTQCGFKLFTRQSAFLLFNLLHIERWAFDVELLFLAQSLNMPIIEIGVNWNEIEGSKIDPFWDSLKMARDLVKIRLMYVLSIWKLDISRIARDA